MNLHNLITNINAYLEIETFHDSSLNGLQIEGKEQINSIICAVSACREVFDVAVEQEADLVLVHHGLYWEGTDPRAVSYMGERVRTLLKHDINLAAYHLPLDTHPEVGNNAQIARMLNLKNVKPWGNYSKAEAVIGVQGKLPQGMNIDALTAQLDESMNTVSSVLRFGSDTVSTVAVVSGGAGNEFLQQAIDTNVDALITGELQEPMYHLAKEANIHVIGAGHYATERWGVLALGEWIERKYGIKYEFVEVENPL